MHFMIYQIVNKNEVQDLVMEIEVILQDQVFIALVQLIMTVINTVHLE